MSQSILVVEDDPDIRDLLREYFGAHGYAVRVADNGKQGLQEARFAPPDVVLLDVMMPQMNGLDFLRSFREFSAAPVLLLTAKDTETDKVLGLELGADDYVTKPFSMAELLARVRAHLRRGHTAAPTERESLSVGPLLLDTAARSVRVRGEAVTLTRTEFDLLAAMMRAPERVFTRLELLEAASEGGEAVTSFGSERTADVHIRNLRGKLEADPSDPKLIQTVFGVGYRLSAAQMA